MLRFTVTAAPATNVDLRVGVSVKDLAGRTTDYITEDTHYERIAADQTSATFSIPIKAVAGSSPDGILEATLLETGGYTVSGDTTLLVNVLDLDEAPSTITIAAKNASVVEGEDAVFTVSRGTDSAGLLEIGVAITETGEVSARNTGDTDIAFILDGDTSGEISIPTTRAADSLGSDAGIELRIQRLDEFKFGDYRFDQNDDSAKVTVDDKTIPELSIGDAQQVHAGNDAEFVITSTRAYTGTVEITYTPVKSGGNFLDESDGTDTSKENTNSGIARTATLTYNNETTRTITIATVDDPSR